MTEYNKLVRDNIPRIIEAEGHEAITRVLTNDEFRRALLLKLREEVDELIEDPSLTERADVEEILQELDPLLGFSPEDIEVARAEKAVKNGRFTQRIFLERVVESD